MCPLRSSLIRRDWLAQYRVGGGALFQYQKRTMNMMYEATVAKIAQSMKPRKEEYKVDSTRRISYLNTLK